MKESPISVMNRMSHVALLNAVARDIKRVYNLADEECHKVALEKAQEEGSCYLLLQTGLRREAEWFHGFCEILQEESRLMSDPESSHGFTFNNNWIEASELVNGEKPTAIGLLITVYYGPVTQM